MHTTHENAAAVLGPHLLPSGDTRIVTFQPRAALVEVVLPEAEGPPIPMRPEHPDGLFSLTLPDLRAECRYRLRVTGPAGEVGEIEDPYRFPPLLGELDLHLLGEGTQSRAYEYLGAHPRTVDGTEGVHFAVWAPNARWVSLISDFNAWDPRAHPLRKRGAGGIWELFIPGMTVGDHYKFHPRSALQDYQVDKADPYGFSAELRPLTASIVTDLSDFTWRDEEWLRRRAQSNNLGVPVAVYEVHLGSWRRRPDGGFLNYRELAEQLVEYVLDMGYTHIELMPVTEHPFDVSWGYQTTGYYAPTSRFGSPSDFMYFVDYCHQHGVGVFMDWVPSHFAKEGHGLGYFDGSHIYEHADPRQGEHFDWGTYVFNYGRGEVLTFLLSNARFWLEVYHLDGFRVDAVASMLYLDHQREPGQWVPNHYGGRENLEAVEFLRAFNSMVHELFPGVLTMAEESTSWPMVSRPVYLGGLGFSLKWNMGWMHDTLEYIKTDPLYRRFIHNTVTFSMLYNYAENYLLPLSHDEAVHGKSPLVYKAPGDEWQKFANLRAMLGYMWAHPGKKLLFMGGDFAQTSEWNFDAQLPWELLAHRPHQGVQDWVRALNLLYTTHPALSELDYEPEGFAWIDCKDVDQSVLIMLRRGKPRLTTRAADSPAAVEESRPFLIIACNFTPVVRHAYHVGVPFPGEYRERLNSDDRRFGGSGVINEGPLYSTPGKVHDLAQSIIITLPPLGVAFIERAD
ncbi:MAG TPA: 1,4-alpha-glucan branching protein GlgB [Candidatus Nanopelagicaceae bacterium]|nr:1,4-alpha-glucan branching protein GlgB [Candidatus Nanopelagicaceae bacterium]